jgi:undecaprenyl diphosphate synthase
MENDVPCHVGIIMDGNGRWARRYGMIRTQGHLEGLKAAKRVVKAASELGIRYLTLYAFSTENWKRASAEVSFIMALVRQHLRKEINFYRENSIRVRYSGDMAGLPRDIAEEINGAISDTAQFDGLQVVLAINYGGKDEIVRALRRLACNGYDMKGVTEEDISASLDNPDIPDPDLVIRSSGEKRLSNFLLWESAYSELFVSDKLWPDFTKEDLAAALEDYQSRKRRFGGEGPDLQPLQAAASGDNLKRNRKKEGE